jgi:glycosyltransferase involved in cell wall biosynthesis
MHSGGAIRTASLVEYLRKHYTVDLITFAPVPAAPFGDILHIDLPPHSRHPFSRLVRNAGRWLRQVPPLVDRFAGFESTMGRWMAGRRWPLALVEHFWAAPYEPLLRKHCDRVVLDLHNVESMLMSGLASPFAAPARIWEKRLLGRFDHVLTASAEDAARIDAAAVVYPNAVPARPPRPPAKVPPPPGRPVVAMSGNFEYAPNADGLRWFQRTVWPRLKRRFPAMELSLIGKGVRPVEDAVPELMNATLAIVPIFAGSGTRLKILEAWQAEIPVVSTALGAEGLGARDGRHLLLAQTAEDFEHQIAALIASPTLAANLAAAALSLLNSQFTWPAAWKRLDQAGVFRAAPGN